LCGPLTFDTGIRYDFADFKGYVDYLDEALFKKFDPKTN